MLSSFLGYFFKQENESDKNNENTLHEDNNNNIEREEEEEESEEDSSEEEDVVYFKEVNRKLREELENDSEEEFSEADLQAQQIIIKERLIRANQMLEDINEYPKYKKAKENSLRRLNALLESEMNFMKKMEKGTLKISPARIKSTNLAHLQAILYTLYHPNINNVCDTRHPIHTKSENGTSFLL